MKNQKIKSVNEMKNEANIEAQLVLAVEPIVKEILINYRDNENLKFKFQKYGINFEHKSIKLHYEGNSFDLEIQYFYDSGKVIKTEVVNVN